MQLTRSKRCLSLTHTGTHAYLRSIDYVIGSGTFESLEKMHKSLWKKFSASNLWRLVGYGKLFSC